MSSTDPGSPWVLDAEPHPPHPSAILGKEKNPDLSKTKGPPNSNQVLEQMKKLEPITPEVMTWGVTRLIRGKAWTPGAVPASLEVKGSKLTEGNGGTWLPATTAVSPQRR